MNISTKTLILVKLLILTITSGCNEEFDLDSIKEGYTTPKLNYFYAYDPDDGSPTCNLHFLPHLLTEPSYCGPVTAMEWNTTFSIESSFPLSDIKIESTESWLSCQRLEGANFSLTAASNNSSFDGNVRIGDVYITPINRTGSDNFNYKIDVIVRQVGRDLILYADGERLFSKDQTISFAENGGTSKTYEVRADGEYTITQGINDTWYTITHSKENNTFYVMANANKTNTVRGGTITIALDGLPSGESKEIKIKILQDKNISNEENQVENSPISVTIDRNYGQDENWDL